MSVAELVPLRGDLLTLIGLLEEQNAALAERAGLLEEQNAALAARAERQDMEIERLLARVAELERRPSRNSKNSNTPLSQDVFGLPEEEKARSGAGPAGRRGKRTGAPGRALGMVEDPDAIEDHRPGVCDGCGSGLETMPSAGFARRQIHDVPLVTVQVTEHRLHKVRCGCGHTTTARAPEQVAASPASYGANLRTLAVYLVVFHHVPVERCAQLIADLTGARVSTGWVSAVVAEAADLTAHSLNLIQALLVLGHILHAGARRRRGSAADAAGCTWPAPST